MLYVMERTTVYFDDDLRRELRDAARREGRAQAALIRDALEAYLRGRARPRPASIGMLEDPALRAGEAKAWVQARWGEARPDR